jgi:Flp pilus assembly protein protease CpaA
MPAWLAPAALLSALVAASISDLRTLRVPAWLSLATLLAGLARSRRLRWRSLANWRGGP